MNKPISTDEELLWAALLEGEKPREAGARLDIPVNRVRYYCYKWSDKGVYDWGVSHDLGWVVPNG